MIGRLLLATLLLCAGCAGWPSRWGDHPCCVETKPTVHTQPIGWHLFDVTAIQPVKESMHLIRTGRKVAGVPVQAYNLEAGQVKDTTFFTDRDISRLTPEQVRWGPTQPADLPVPPYTVTKPKVEGKTAGFFVKDSRGVRYLFKLDPVDNPEMLSGAEVVTSKLLYALGYHVPIYEIVWVKPQEMSIAEGARIKNEQGAPEPFTQERLAALIKPRLRDGRMRVCCTKIIEGEILGPASFKKFKDCADMRALKIAYAWLNNVDAKDHNSLLIWDGKRTVGYLIDFGTSLGADAGIGGPKEPCEGWTYAVDLKEWALKVATFGVHEPHCELDSPQGSSVGLFSENVDPKKWKPYAPNIAFKEMTPQDARWITKRLAQLSPQQITAAVEAGAYTRQEDILYLTKMLLARRDRIVSYYK